MKQKGSSLKMSVKVGHECLFISLGVILHEALIARVTAMHHFKTGSQLQRAQPKQKYGL